MMHIPTKLAAVALAAVAVAAPSGAQAASHAVKAHITKADQRAFLKHALPYYDKKAPKWCEEDMICWVGSKADNRSDARIYRELACDIVATSATYVESPRDSLIKDRDFKACDIAGVK